MDNAQKSDLAPFLEIWAKVKKLSEIKPPLAQWDLGISGLEWGLQDQNEGPLTLMKLRNPADGNSFFKDKIKLVHYWSWHISDSDKNKYLLKNI